MQTLLKLFALSTRFAFTLSNGDAMFVFRGIPQVLNFKSPNNAKISRILREFHASVLCPDPCYFRSSCIVSLTLAPSRNRSNPHRNILSVVSQLTHASVIDTPYCNSVRGLGNV